MNLQCLKRPQPREQVASFGLGQVQQNLVKGKYSGRLCWLAPVPPASSMQVSVMPPAKSRYSCIPLLQYCAHEL